MTSRLWGKLPSGDTWSFLKTRLRKLIFNACRMMLKMGRRIRSHALTSQLMTDPCLQYPTFLGNVKVKPCSLGKSPSLCKIYPLFISAVGLWICWWAIDLCSTFLVQGDTFQFCKPSSHCFLLLQLLLTHGSSLFLQHRRIFPGPRTFILLQFLPKYSSIDLYIYSGVILSSFFTFKPCLFFLKILFFI